MVMNPLVSAVMVTGKLPARLTLARAAIRSFLDQTYTASELVIINDGTQSVLPDDLKRVVLMREIMVDPGQGLGALRNIGIHQAHDDWIIQWDDDDFYHPERIASQLRAAVPGKPVLLKKQVRYSFNSNAAYVMDWNYPKVPAIPGTVLYPNKPGLKYRNLGKAEDEYFLIDNFGNDVVVLDNKDLPHLYTRFCHGSNTWGESHIMGRRLPDIWELPPAVREYLRDVLSRFYADRITRALPAS